MGVPPHWVPALCGGYSFANRPASSASMSALKFRRCVYARKSPRRRTFLKFTARISNMIVVPSYLTLRLANRARSGKFWMCYASCRSVATTSAAFPSRSKSYITASCWRLHEYYQPVALCELRSRNAGNRKASTEPLQSARKEQLLFSHTETAPVEAAALHG